MLRLRRGCVARQGAAGSAFAAECVRQYEAAGDREPSVHHSVFHHYSFAFVGRRNADGQFLQREEFYDLSAAFYRAYQDRVARYLGDLAEELLSPASRAAGADART